MNAMYKKQLQYTQNYLVFNKNRNEYTNLRPMAASVPFGISREGFLRSPDMSKTDGKLIQL